MATSKDIVTNALMYIGIKEGSKEHKALVKEYNAVSPRPRGYKAKYTDPWCALFASVCMQETGVNKYREVSVQQMYNLFKLDGKVTKTPKEGYLVFYQWDSGMLDHVGILYKIDGAYIDVIEGNYNDSVGVRRIAKSDKRIFAYGAFSVPSETAYTPVTDDVVLAVIRGQYGNGEDRKVRLAAAGYDYDAVQAAVNAWYKSHK